MKSKSINRDKIKLYITSSLEFAEILYNDEYYSINLNNISKYSWMWSGPVWMDDKNPLPTNKLEVAYDRLEVTSEIDRLLYSDIIDSFIEYYISEQS